MTRSPLINISLRFGAIAGVLGFVLMLGLYYMGRHPLMMGPFFDFRIFLFGIFIFFALKEFRDGVQNGVLYFWQGMIASLVLFTVANLLCSLGMQIFGWLEPDFVSAYVTQMQAYLNTFPEEEIKRIGKDVFDRNFQLLPSTNISDLTLTFFAKGILIGLFVSIIISIILRKQPKT